MLAPGTGENQKNASLAAQQEAWWVSGRRFRGLGAARKPSPGHLVKESKWFPTSHFCLGPSSLARNNSVSLNSRGKASKQTKNPLLNFSRL